MLPEAVFHSNEIPYIFPVRSDRLKIRIRARKNDIQRCRILMADRYETPGSEIPAEMVRCASTRHHDYFECEIHTPARRLRYQFLLKGYDGSEIWYGERGAYTDRFLADFFQFPYICDADIPTTPDWLKDTVMYQIFPDRFHRSEETESLTQSGLTDWSCDQPDRNSIYGGNLRGIIDKIPYLAQLGINAIYLNPVFDSPSNHKYDTTDYYRIDPAFGDEDTLIQLVKTAHNHKIRVILDAVFNHTGDQFFAFRDLMELGEHSRYRSWYCAPELPIRQTPKPNYETFGIDIASMPKLNTQNPEVIAYFIAVAIYWIKKAGIDGWRLDVANEVDHTFWRELRKAVKSRYPEAVLIGEIMHYAGPWLQGDQFDGVMNYTWRETMLDFFARQTIGAKAFVELIDYNRMSYTDQAIDGMMQLLGSHDTQRFLTACKASTWGWEAKSTAVSRLKLAASFQMTYLGMPTIYYGDEIGMYGATDPDCRRPMIWEAEKQNADVLAHYRNLIRIRMDNAPLRHGRYRLWFCDEARNVFGFTRTHNSETVCVVINHSPKAHALSLDDPRSARSDSIRDLLTEQTWAVTDHIPLSIPPFSCLILT